MADSCHLAVHSAKSSCCNWDGLSAVVLVCILPQSFCAAEESGMFCSLACTVSRASVLQDRKWDGLQAVIFRCPDNSCA